MTHWTTADHHTDSTLLLDCVGSCFRNIGGQQGLGIVGNLITSGENVRKENEFVLRNVYRGMEQGRICPGEPEVLCLRAVQHWSAEIL